MSPTLLTVIALALAAVAFLLTAGALLGEQTRRDSSAKVIQRALQQSLQGAAPAPTDPLRLPDAHLPGHWLTSRLGRLLVGDEDRRLIEQSGLPLKRTQLALLVIRLTLALALPPASFALLGHNVDGVGEVMLLLGTAFAAGFMLPKWILARLAARHRSRLARELPLFVDLLGLLQGVGLSLDQSLQVVASDFLRMLPVLGNEVNIANRQYAQGRTRDQAFHRMAHLHGNQNLTDFVALLVQVDKHGGAIQEPIRQFGDRLRVQRKADMKARIGKITVKMTVVMVSTLLPALILVTAGPGFLAVIRSVVHMGG